MFYVVTSCTKEEVNYIEPNKKEDIKISSITFHSKDNPMQLIGDVTCDIIGDSIINCWIPYLITDKKLIANISYIGDKLLIDTVTYTTSSRYDFSKPVKLILSNSDTIKKYMLYVYSFTGLPVLWIDTDNGVDITSKENYVRAKFKLVENVVTRSVGETIEDSLSIKGRGNATWTAYPKKPYRLKLDKKYSLLGEPEDKAWVLLANYSDKTFLRNRLAFYLSSISTLDYTPRSHFVELILNGIYQGTYELCEKIEVGENRVNIGKNGFLMEQDGYATTEDDSKYFETNHLERVVNIKEPSVDYGDENFNYIHNFVLAAENALYSDNFKDPEEGWKKYLDIETLVDYYLIGEIAKNIDTFRASSTYFTLIPGDKIKFGPVWDYDHAFGNYVFRDSEKYDGFYTKQYGWLPRLFEDPDFVSKVKERINYFYERRFDIISEINDKADYLKHSAIENDMKWGVLFNNYGHDKEIWGNYENEVQYLKKWLNLRICWLKEEFDRM